MLTATTLKFLTDLQANNDRTWFLENKPRFEKARMEFENFIQDLIHGIASFDPAIKGLEAKKCIYRIYKDARFSKDKAPYKTHFGAHLGAYGPKVNDRAGYYIHIEPGASMLAGGAYMPPAPWLAAIRDAIDRDGAALREILASPAFKKNFGTMEGEALKTAPKGYPATHLYIDLLRQKSFLATHKLKDTEVKAPDLLKRALVVFKALKPFDDFLNEAMEN